MKLKSYRHLLVPSGAACLLLGASPIFAQPAVVRPAAPPPITQASAVARYLDMPSTAQLDAVNALNASDQAQEQEVAVARAAIVEATLAVPANPGLITQQVAALAAAELALANFRAGELARIQAGPSRLTPQQVSILFDPRTLVAPAAGRGGGGGGGRGAVGSQDYPADPNAVIQAIPGFRVEIVARAYRPIQGSWISITQDNQGRLILGANEQQPFTRLTLNANGQVTKNETIYTPLSEAMGTEWRGDSLYVQGGRAVGDGFVYGKPNPTFCCESGLMGLHRLRDNNNDGNFETLETLRTVAGNEMGHSDHGVHDPEVSPDGNHLYIINGNGVYQPEDASANSPVRNNADDRIIPTLGALTGNGIVPAGFIARTDFEGRDFQLFAAGIRNALHFAFNGDGEIFFYDSDHEPEVGVPWYKPTRVLWAPSAANFGHRGSSGKYPSWWEDVTPPLFDIGLGSPVGVTFGYNTKFPGLYQKALYIADNNYGRIMALHLKPVGSGYTVSSMENFVFPKSLYTDAPATAHNVTDMMVASDGTFYYLIGNRNTQSYLMRVVYTGNQPTAKVEYRESDGAGERAVRRSLEAFHWTSNNPQAMNAAWPHLGSEDRNIRYAARVALETVPASVWKSRALAETDANTSIIAMLALARTGGSDANEEIFATLEKFPLVSLPDRVKLQKLRVIQVAVSRNGKPSEETIRKVIADIDAGFPAATFELNTDMSQILAAFNAPTVAAKTMRLAQQSRIYQENFEYRYNLRSVTAGWTPELRRAYFQWFNQDHTNTQYQYFYREWFARVNRLPAVSGNAGPMGQVRTAALATLTDAERADAELSAILSGFQGAAGGGRGGGQFGF